MEIIINTIIPAQSGWALAVFVEGKYSEGNPCFYFADVIAWRIQIKRHPDHNEHHYVTPITVGGTNVENLNSAWALRRPDGVYLDDEENELGSEAQALANFQKWVDYERAQKQKTA
jgi:hypothetical protein